MEKQNLLSMNDPKNNVVKIAVASLCGLVAFVAGFFILTALMPKDVDNAPLSYIAVQ